MGVICVCVCSFSLYFSGLYMVGNFDQRMVGEIGLRDGEADSFGCVAIFRWTGYKCKLIIAVIPPIK